jgi:hypothetical protein
MSVQISERMIGIASRPRAIPASNTARTTRLIFVAAWILALVFYFLQYALRSARGVMVHELRDAFVLTPLGRIGKAPAEVGVWLRPVWAAHFARDGSDGGGGCGQAWLASKRRRARLRWQSRRLRRRTEQLASTAMLAVGRSAPAQLRSRRAGLGLTRTFYQDQS